jgi:hypothetical protein
MFGIGRCEISELLGLATLMIVQMLRDAAWLRSSTNGVFPFRR